MALFDQAAIHDAVMASLRNDPPAGHATAAKVLGYGSGAVFGGLAARNMTVR